MLPLPHLVDSILHFLKVRLAMEVRCHHLGAEDLQEIC